MSAGFISRNPFTGELFAEFENDSFESIERKLSQSEAAYKKWKKLQIKERAAFFTKLSVKIRARVKEISELISFEMGKPISEAIAEVNKCAVLCEYYSNNSSRLLNKEIVEDQGLVKGEIVYEPLGTILQIMPWNFPIWQVFRCTVPTLIAGNVSILKHAPNVPRTAKLIETLFNDSGFPEHVFQNIFSDETLIERVIESDTIKGVALTGSVRAGSSVASIAGKNIKPTVLELGGSDAFIVMDDADIVRAAKVGALSRFQNNGQTCIAAKRFIVSRTVSDKFLNLLKDEILSLKAGNPLDPEVRISTMARVDLASELQNQVDKSIELGAEVILDGGQIGDRSSIFKPVILSNIKKNMPAYSQELFGPVLSFFEFEDIEEAIKLANDTIFGLGASVWSTNINQTKEIAKYLEVGTVAINQLVHSSPFLPFGGIKKSGYGRELGTEGLKSFVNTKSIII
jgi:succinate-semialdehyde dehydrogenase/glutarate-semialdehyde dehydrogenase